MTTTATSNRPDRAMRASAVAPTAAVVTLGVVTVVVMALIGLSQVAGVGTLTGRLPGIVIGIPRLSVTLPPPPHALPKPALPPRAAASRPTGQGSVAAPAPTAVPGPSAGAEPAPVAPPQAVSLVAAPAPQEAHTPRRPPVRRHGHPVRLQGPVAPAPSPQPVQPAVVPATLLQATAASTGAGVELVRGLLSTTTSTTTTAIATTSTIAPAKRSFASVRTSASRSAASLALVAAARPVGVPRGALRPAQVRAASAVHQLSVVRVRPAASLRHLTFAAPPRHHVALAVPPRHHQTFAAPPRHHQTFAAPPRHHQAFAAPRKLWAARGTQDPVAAPKAPTSGAGRGGGPATAATRVQDRLAHWPWHTAGRG